MNITSFWIVAIVVLVRICSGHCGRDKRGRDLRFSWFHKPLLATCAKGGSLANKTAFKQQSAVELPF